MTCARIPKKTILTLDNLWQTEQFMATEHSFVTLDYFIPLKLSVSRSADLEE